MNRLSIFTKGLFFENPILVLAMGLCPAIAVATTAKLGFALGITTCIVLIVSSVFVCLLRKILHGGYSKIFDVLVVCGTTTVIQIIIKAFWPEIDDKLGIYLPLVAISIIIIEEISYFAKNHNIVETSLSSFGIGIGYLWGVVLLGGIREFLATGSVWEIPLFNTSLSFAYLFTLVPGGLLTLGLLMAFNNWIIRKIRNRGKGL